MTQKIRVGFFALRELHVPVLIPVWKALKEVSEKAGLDIDAGFLAPPFQDDENLPQEGLRPETLQHLKTLGIPFWGEQPPEPRYYNCVVTADACTDRIEGWGPVVCVGHGTISKNIYFIDVPGSRRESFHTALCVPGPWYVGSFKGTVHTRIEPTGFPKMDEYAADHSEKTRLIFEQYKLSSEKKTILFAPTYNMEFTGMIMLASQWSRLNPDKYQILVKLHGATDPRLRESYRELCSKLPHMHFVDDPSVVPYMKCADIVISDVSSAYVEAFILGVPVIVVNNPEMYGFNLYNPEAVEFKVRDAAYQINDGEELLPLLEKLEQEDPLAEKREAYAAMLFPPPDGKNSLRAADVIRQVAEGKIRRTSKAPWHVLLPDHPESPEHQNKVIENLKRALFDIKILCRNPENWNLPGYEIAPLPTDSAIPAPCKLLTGDHIFCWNWDEVWELSWEYHDRNGIYGPVFGAECTNPWQQYFQALKQQFRTTPEFLQKYLKQLHFFETWAVQTLLPDGAVFAAGQEEHAAIGRVTISELDGVLSAKDQVSMQTAFSAWLLNCGIQPRIGMGVLGI